MKRTIAAIAIAMLASMSLSALTTTDLTNSMMASNPDILKAREEISKALLDVKDAKAGFTPTIDLTVTGSYIANPIDPIRINLGDYINTSAYGLNNDYITLYNGQENMYYQFSLSLTQPLFTWGKLTKAVTLYQGIYDARTLQLQDAIEKAKTELLTRTAALHYLLEIQKVLSDQTEIAGRLVELADSAQSNGMMLATDALAVHVQARQLDVAKAQIDKQVVSMMTELRNLTGINDLQATNIEFNEEETNAVVQSLMKADYSALSSRCLSDNRTTFRLLGSLANIASLTNDIAGASVNWKPDVALVVNADYTGSRLPFVETDWYGKDDWSATITIAMKTTILDGGKAVRNVSRTQSDVREAMVDTQSARAKISSAMDENWTNISVGMSQIEYQNALSEQLSAKADVNRNLLDTGYGSESDYLQVQLERNNYRIEILKTRIELAAAAYTLLYLQGEITQ